MGTWGPKLYQDDVAEEVKSVFKDQLKRGKKGTDITKELIKEYEDIINSEDEAESFWLALADTQWNLGRLEDYVKKNALFYIGKESSIRRWEEENPKKAKVRKKVLIELKEKLISEPPKEKYIPQYKLYQCEWKIGDVYAYPLEGENAEKYGVQGHYLLLHKVGEYDFWPGHIIPIVKIKITAGKKLPENELQFKESEYIQISVVDLEEDIFGGVEGKCLNNGVFIEDKEFLKEKVKKLGGLPEYLLKIICTSKRNIPKNLIYINNFQELNSPEIEYIPNNKVNINSVAWKNIEEFVLERYHGHNLRNFKMYKKL